MIIAFIEKPWVKVVLYPFTILYSIIVWFRNRFFDYGILQSTEYNIPIISVGNITVGGTGKTPHVEYLINLLSNEHKIAMVSRGYMRKSKGLVIANHQSTAEEIGDEPRQIIQKYPNTIVASDAKRVRAINKLLELHSDIKAIILDDAFQHRHVSPGISILLIDYNRPVTADIMLPAGKLREPASERKRADIIIVTKCPEQIKPIDQRLLEKELKMFAFQRIYFTKFVYGELTPVFKELAKNTSLSELKEEKPTLISITGISNPEPFKAKIREISPFVEDFEYPDHYRFTASDFHQIIDCFQSIPNPVKAIITTEKDAMRIQSFPDLDDEIKSHMFYLPIHVEFLNNEEADFNHFISSYVKHNKPDSILYKKPNNK